MTGRGRALRAAILLFGEERGRALLGCDWGGPIAAPDDMTRCTGEAVKLVTLYSDGTPVVDVKLCGPHKDRIYAETQPRAGMPS